MYTLEPANYTDYREFLKTRFENLKLSNKNFSLQACANRSGLSKSHIQFILKKQRHIALDKFPALAKALKLTSNEEYFIYLMICKNASQNPEVKNHFENIMKRIRHLHVETQKKTSNEINGELYQNGIAMLIQSLVRLKNFQEDPEWIQKTLDINNLSPKEILKIIKHLENTKAIKRDSDGNLTAIDHDIFKPDPYNPQGFNIYTKAAEFVASLMQDPNKFSPSVYSSMSLAMDQENLLKTEKLMIETHHKICELAKKSKDPTTVAFIGNFFMTICK